MLLIAKQVLTETQLTKLKSILGKDKLTPMEMMEEAAFTELINRQSLEELQKLEGDKKDQWMLGRRSRFEPGELIIKYKQTTRGEETNDLLGEEPLKKRCKLKSTFTFPSAKHLPKNLNTKIVKSNFTTHTPATETLDGKKMAAQQYSDYYFVVNTSLSREEQFE